MRLHPRYNPLVWLKGRMPSTLFARSFLIIVLPVVLMQILVTYIFFDTHWRRVNNQLATGLAGDVAWVVDSYRDDPSPAAVVRLQDRAETVFDFSVVRLPGARLPTSPAPIEAERSIYKGLRGRLGEGFWFDTRRYPDFVDIRVQTADGVLRIIAPRERAVSTRGHVFILWMIAATVLLTLVAILFIRNQVRAIERLAVAADALGKGVDPGPFKPYGAREVRQAAQAFLAMKARIQRFVDQRTAMLASVSHDLRTPLTRLKLELALADPGPRVEAMKRDLADMEHMIDEYLDFARGEGGEATARIDLAGVIEDVSEGARRGGAQVTVAADQGLAANVRPNALKRALANLIMNAAAHGEHVAVSARLTPGGGVEILVDDDGPGIPEDRFEEAFTPFARIDGSRNQNIKGVGLGLAIARDVARGHGGEVSLGRSPLGGLRALMRLPG